MKILFRIYTASCLIVVAFFGFYGLYLDQLLGLGPWVAILIGGGILALTGWYIYRIYRREGFDLGWFLVNNFGFWILALAGFGFFLLLSGLLFQFVPNAVESAYERGAWTVAGVLVLLFWFALIYMFVVLSVMMIAGSTASLRVWPPKGFLFNAVIALICLAMAGLFFSLFLEVVSDIYFRISVSTQWTAIWIFIGLATAAGIVYGVWEEPSELLDKQIDREGDEQ